ncbi:cartilage-associated protein-like [Ochlerotatus camptorhynchus]|uniref:cartilage-associated protein-like n=1 Tax=Ochlerotatus camptorhynchus TaxID=644619 RepID=UPI0031D8E02B
MFRKCTLLAYILLTTQYVVAEDTESNNWSESFIDLYERGVQSYLSNEFEDCVYFLEFALDKYKNYYEATANCRIECEYKNRDIKNKGGFLHPNDLENLHFYELILKRTLCLTKCRNRNSNYLPFEGDFDNYFMDIFQNREAYSYLHNCYTKTNQVTLAASAALTYMVKHPGDEIMKKNFELAIEKPGVDKEGIVDLEEKKFVKLFVAGILAINDKEWQTVISVMESSVMQFIYDENQCRAYCEGEFDHGFMPDFVSAIGNHFANVLYCKRNCTREMGMVRGKYYYNLFAGHYQYLQMAYYEAGKFEESYRAGLSYLLFNKGDIDMLNNLKMIEKETKGMLNENFFKVRREANEYHDRNLYEDKLASFIKEEFNNLADSEEELITESSSDDQGDENEAETKDNDVDNEIEQKTFIEDMVYQTPSRGYQRDEL